MQIYPSSSFLEYSFSGISRCLDIVGGGGLGISFPNQKCISLLSREFMEYDLKFLVLKTTLGCLLLVLGVGLVGICSALGGCC